MRNTTAFPKLSLRSVSCLLHLIAMLRCTVSFLSTAPVAGFRSLDRFRGVDASAFRSPEPHGRRHSGAVRFFSMRRENSWILLVDDEDPIRRAVGQFLLDKGYKVTTCADGRAALQLALSKRKEGIGPVPDCIISDIRMPGMDGLELLGSVRNNAEHSVLSHVPVVLLTARANVQDRIAGYDAGADAYLTKPFSPEELVAIVDNVIERSEDISIEREELHKTVGIEDLKKDLAEIKDLLLNKGGCGIGNGWVQQTNVFLSKDERNVLDLLSRGLITKEIAANTHLSPRRIEQLLTGMFRKTGVKNRTELVRWGVSTGNVE